MKKARLLQRAWERRLPAGTDEESAIVAAPPEALGNEKIGNGHRVARCPFVYVSSQQNLLTNFSHRLD
jgi:hypothetical protein